MKNLTLLFLFFALPCFSQNPSDDAKFLRENYSKREVMVPMRDGVRLFTAIYLPKNQSKKYPILMKRTPYSCAPYGVDNIIEDFQNMTLARSGYILVFQDVRGRYMSEGKFEDVRPFNPSKKTPADIDEASDTYDTAEWLTNFLKAETNGKIGVYGISYPGFYATMAALSGHPAVVAVSPQAPVTDWFEGDDFHHGGALMLMDAFGFYSGFGKPRPKPTMDDSPGFSDFRTPDNYDFYLKTGAVRNFSEKYGMAYIPFWQDLMSHPDMDPWWQARNPRPHLKNIQPAILTVGGLFDAEDCFGAWKTYEAIEKQNPTTAQNRLVMGPWVHGGWKRTTGERLGNVVFGQKTSDFYQKNIEAPFFEHHLKDAPDPKLAEANVFETGSNRWTTYETWPPKNAQPTKFFFSKNGKIATVAPTENSKTAFDEYPSDPAKPVPYTENVHLQRTNEYMTDDQRFAARRPDVLVFETENLAQPMTLTGEIVADLWVSTTGTDADFVVKLIDVFPDTLSGVENGVPLGGYQMLVRGEILRGRYRNGFEKGVAFTPGKVEQVKVVLPAVAHTFLPGHRLMIQIQSSWFPLADRNPQKFVNIYKATDADFQKAAHRVWRSAKWPSGVVLPVLKN